MSVYAKNGIAVNLVYSKNGPSLLQAYDIDRNELLQHSVVLKVMTYNVGGWYIGSGRNVPAAQKEQYLALQKGMIEENDPDVLVIQEYLANFADDGTSALSILQELFPYVHTKVSGTYYGRAICSKYPITNYVERKFTQEASRYFDSCTITVDGIPVTFVNTHLGLTQANRTPEITQLIQYLNTLDTFVVCGDYNTGITNADLTTSSTAYINNVKPFIDAGFHTANFGQFGFMLTCVDRTNGINYYLDNEYASSNIKILDAYVDETKLTDLIDDPIDHMPLIAEIKIGGQAGDKYFSVLGDSYSAFQGDVYPNTNNIWYTPGKNNVQSKDMMWYRLLAESTGMTLYRNASFSGSPICYDGWSEGTTDSNQSAFVARYNDVGNADIIFVFGGTNDSWIGVSQGEYKYSDWTETDLESFRPALACLFYSLKNAYPNSEIIFIKNTGLTTAIQDSISVITTYYSVPVIELSNITKTDGHPTNVGMTQISTQVEAFLRANDLIGA